MEDEMGRRLMRMRWKDEETTSGFYRGEIA